MPLPLAPSLAVFSMSLQLTRVLPLLKLVVMLPLLWLRLPSVRAWQASAPLGTAGQLSWTSDVAKGVIMFEISAETDGWLGLGLSPTGTMAGADLAIGWFDQHGTAHSKVGLCLPPPAAVQADLRLAG